MAYYKQANRKLRVWRGIGSRGISADSSKVLALVPMWPGETVKWIRMDCKAISTNVTSGQVAEINWRGVVIPAADVGFNINTTTLQSDTIAGSANYVDQAFDNFIRSPYGSQPSHYGGDQALETGADEAIPGWAEHSWVRRHGLADDFYRREGFLFPSTATYHIDSFNQGLRPNIYRREPSFLMFGATRYKIEANTGFNWNDINTVADPDTGSITRTSLIWDPKYVSNLLSDYPSYTVTGDGDASTQHVRSLMQILQGDNYIEGSTTDDDYAVTAAVKMQVGIMTPITNVPALGT